LLDIAINDVHIFRADTATVSLPQQGQDFPQRQTPGMMQNVDIEVTVQVFCGQSVIGGIQIPQGWWLHQFQWVVVSHLVAAGAVVVYELVHGGLFSQGDFDLLSLFRRGDSGGALSQAYIL